MDKPIELKPIPVAIQRLLKEIEEEKKFLRAEPLQPGL
jgi:hypothetical protein